MALIIDSHAVLRALADHPEAFPAVGPDLDELARKLLGKQLKSKTTDAILFKEIYSAVGASTISTILDGFQANDLTGLVKKIDPHSAHAKAATDLGAVRSHIAGLANGSIQASVKPEKGAKPQKATKTAKDAAPKIGGILESKVHSGGKAKAPVRKKS